MKKYQQKDKEERKEHENYNTVVLFCTNRGEKKNDHLLQIYANVEYQR
jgi:hypothetical protein